MPRTRLSPLSLLLLSLCALPALAQVKASPPLEAAAAASGWNRIAPDLSAAAAAAEVRAIAGLADPAFLEKAYALILLRDPETAYSLGISKRYAIPEDELTDLSDAHALGTRELYLALSAEAGRRLAAAPRAAGPAAGTAGGTAVALEALVRWLGDKALDIEYSLAKYPVSPYVNSADQLALAYFTEFRTVRDAAEAGRYIACLEKLPAKMRGLAAALDLRARAGVILPRGIHDYALRGLKEIADSPPRSNPFYDAFAAKLSAAMPPGPARDALLDRAAKACEAYALPAWRLLAEAMARQSPSAPAEGGAWRLPGGAAYYQACLRRLTTTDQSPLELHETGKRELARIQAETRAAFAALGYPRDAPLVQLYARLGREGGVLAGRELLGAVEGHIAAMEARLGEIVSRRPRLGVEAVFGDSGGYYQPPSTDGSRPGRYFVAASDRRYAFDVASTAFHETLPGHHLQIATALEAELPGFLRGADFLGFTEGWALYAERLAKEMGLYAKDPAGELGRLRMEALRAARLVADTGVNALGWSFGQAYAFLQENTGHEAGMLQSDVSRYIFDPGQATAYYSGYLAILEFRERSRSALGSRFEARRFHDLLLGGGALPLDLLSRSVDRWIAAEKAR